jgi:uncharacterized membrane protein YcaP (DUF421 family)
MEAFKQGINSFYNVVGPLLGLGVEPKDLSFTQISLRGIVVLLASLLIIRFARKRSLAEKTAFDAVLMIILASVLARAINGSGPFFATLGGAFVMVCLHRLLGWLCYRSHLVGLAIKGRPDVIVQNGEINWREMHRNYLSKHDLEEDLRSSAKTEDLSQIRIARVERSGDISFIKKDG